MARHSPLDDKPYAEFAWGRYKRLMRWMGLGTAVAVIAALAWMYHDLGMVSIHLFIATALGVTFATMLMAALMSLIFLSNGTGHDAAVADSEDAAGGDRR